ncbi:MAG: hypothetical protein HYV09_40160 [Deltaproteobacteria bacterium]|nr:hypothetical protein [Deltaproteobacteria bacterium]
MPSLFTAHPPVLETAYSELKRRAFEQASVLVGTPGSVGERMVNERAFLYRQFYDADGRKRAEYIGPADLPSARASAEAVRERIAETNGLLAQARLLARQGYVRVDAHAGSVVAALANHGLFRAGAVLVGSHAYGVLLNELGIRGAAFRTEDVDVARDARLQLSAGSVSFAQMLEDSHIVFAPVPGFDRKTPPTSFKAPGRHGLRVDLLVPTSGREVGVKAIPELDAHATALPHLRYLLAEPVDAILVGRENVTPVRVPSPERFAWHKALLSQVRTTTGEKITKDLHQAAVLFAVLAEREPGALADAWRAMDSKRKARVGGARVRDLLVAHGQIRAADVLSEIIA